MPEDELIPLIVEALHHPAKRKAVLRQFEHAMRTANLPLPEDPRYYIFTTLQVDAALYEPDPSRFVLGMVDEERMQAILVKAVGDLQAAGFSMNSLS